MKICQCNNYANSSQIIVDQVQKGKSKTFPSSDIFMNWILNFKSNYYV